MSTRNRQDSISIVTEYFYTSIRFAERPRIKTLTSNFPNTMERTC